MLFIQRMIYPKPDILFSGSVFFYNYILLYFIGAEKSIFTEILR